MGEKYDAFISYSRHNTDLAERISRRLRLYRPPKRAGLGNRRVTVFRDVERLTASSDLSEELVERVTSADKLVLLCSPSSAKSKYVDAEVTAFMDSKSLDLIIFVLLEGDLPAILPPSLRGKNLNPLYIDLRGGKRSTFRNESLRLIAAIYGVDYADLRREDEARRRRQWYLAIVASLIGAFLLASAYLITSSRPIVWERLEQPDATEGYRMTKFLPVHEVAVFRQDPSIILYLGQNGDWYGDVTVWYGDEELIYLAPDWSSKEFIDRVAEKLQGSDSLETVAAVEFENIGETGGSVRVEIAAVLDERGNPRFIRNLKFEGTTHDDQSRKTMDIPFTLQESGEDPFNLGQLAEQLLANRLIYGDSGNVVGTITDLIGGTTEDVDFSMGGLYSFHGYETREEAFGPEYKIFTNANVEQIEINGGRLEDHQYDRSFWERIVKNEEWITYTKPETEGLGFYYTDNLGPIEFAAGLPGVGDERALANVLNKLDRWGRDTLLDVSRISTNTSKGRLDALKLEWYLPPVGSGGNEFDETDWVVRFGESGQWKRVQLPDDNVEGLWLLEEDDRSVLLLTAENGFFRTWDGGISWEEANYDETGFVDGKKVKTLVVDGASATFALIDRNTNADGGENPLFRLQQRNWIDRWRSGLIQLLQ
jgi:hypothetical protein